MVERMRLVFSREIDDQKWETMKSDSTIPFEKPDSGMISVKIVDHTGITHEKVIDLNGAAIQAE